MRILPMYAHYAERRHWIVRLLRFSGYVQTICFMIIGFAIGRNGLARFIFNAFISDIDTAIVFGQLFGVALGFCVGIFCTLAVWGLALIIDDIHAIRIYTAGYETVKDETPNDVENESFNDDLFKTEE